MHGDVAGLQANIRDVLGTPDQIEAVRQELLLASELAEAMGIPMKVVQNPQLFADYLTRKMQDVPSVTDEDAMDNFVDSGGNTGTFSAGGGRSAEEELANLRKKFANLQRTST